MASMSMVVPSMEGSTGRIVLSTGESFTLAKSTRSFGTAPKHDPRHPSGFQHRVNFSHCPWAVRSIRSMMNDARRIDHVEKAVLELERLDTTHRNVGGETLER